MQKLTIQNYRFEVRIDDDRDRWRTRMHQEVCAGEAGTLTIRDCGGNEVVVELEAPGRDTQPLEDCPEGERCVEVGSRNAECRLAPAPPSGPQTIVRFAANPASIDLGDCTMLSWQVRNATRVRLHEWCTPSEGPWDFAVTEELADGQWEVCPATRCRNTRYELDVYGSEATLHENIIVGTNE